jgi:hypothetical protein
MKIRTRTKAGQDIPKQELVAYPMNSWGAGAAMYPYRQRGGPDRNI